MLRTSPIFFTALALSFSISINCRAEREPFGGPVDVVRENVAKRSKSKRARDLKKAHELLEKKEFTKAAALAATVQSDPDFGDYGYWLHALSFQGQAQKALRAKKWAQASSAAEKAITLFARIPALNPYSPLIKSVPKDIGHSEILIADALASQVRHKSALAAYAKALQRLSASNALGQLRPDTIEKYSRSCSKQEDEVCAAWLYRLLMMHPRNAEEAKVIVKEFPAVLLRPKSPRGDRSTQTYRGPDLDFAAFDAAMTLHLSGKFSDAVAAFRKFIDEYPRSAYRYRARFWLADALVREKEADSAQLLFSSLQAESPLTYYGMLASISSGKALESAVDATIPLATDWDSALQPHEIMRLRRVERFLAENATALAGVELRELSVREGFSSPFLMYLASLQTSGENYANAFSIMGELISRGYENAVSSFTLRMIFPTPFMETIQKVAQENSLDPILLLSLIKQESSFGTVAVSSVGALGLMQVMPATALDVDGAVLRSDLETMETNLRIGSKYLAQLLKRFNGNIVFALAGYNAGPAAVDRWLRDAPQKHAMLEFIESIPYRETREYVGSILRNYYWYSKRLGNEMKPLTFFWGQESPAPAQPASKEI